VPDAYETIRPASTPVSGEPASSGKPRRKMTPEATLGTALLAFAGANGLVGLLMLTFPKALWASIGQVSDAEAQLAYTSTRFAGALMITVALIALLVIRRPAGQSTLVTILCIGETLVGVATLLNAIGDHPPTAFWFEWPIALVSIALALFMWWARFVGRKALKAI
jgi:hypothetical protein